MKKLLSGILALICCFSLVSCSAPADSTPKDYVKIINEARLAEDMEAFPLVSTKDDEMADSVFAMMNLNPDDIDTFAISCSFMNVQAYCVAIIKPVDGKTEAVSGAVTEYVSMQQKNMENYLPEQFEIAKNTKQATVKSGEIVVCMSADSSDVFDKIKSALK